MTTAEIKVSVLRWAFNRSGLTVDEARKKFGRIDQWLAGESQPTMRQIESLAKATLTPLGFFFLKEPPEERIPIPYFRTLSDRTSSELSVNLLETIYTMQRRQAWMREFLIEEGESQLPFVNTTKVNEQSTLIADRIRRALRLERGWAAQQSTWTEALRVLREAIDNAGVIVSVSGIVNNNTHRKLDPDEFRGFVLVDEYAPLVFVNGVDAKAAQMFTLAHELAHVFFGSSAAFDLRGMQPADDPMEQACNRVAAEFLVPERELSNLWLSLRQAPNPFQAIARQFKVSEVVAARRALDLALIDRNAFFEFYRSYEKAEHRAGKQQTEGGKYYATQKVRIGRLFGVTVVRAAKEGKLLYSDAFRLTGLYGRTFDRFATSLEKGGP